MLYIVCVAGAEVRHGSAVAWIFLRQADEQGHAAIAFAVVYVVLPALTGESILALRFPVE